MVLDPAGPVDPSAGDLLAKAQAKALVIDHVFLDVSPMGCRTRCDVRRHDSDLNREAFERDGYLESDLFQDQRGDGDALHATPRFNEAASMRGAVLQKVRQWRD